MSLTNRHGRANIPTDTLLLLLLASISSVGWRRTLINMQMEDMILYSLSYKYFYINYRQYHKHIGIETITTTDTQMLNGL